MELEHSEENRILSLSEQKQVNTQRMVEAVNEVKKLEVELDRAGQNLSQIQQKFADHEAAVAVSSKRPYRCVNNSGNI